MRLLLDLQGAQGSSRNSGLGRYSRELARAIAQSRGGHEVLVLLNAARPAAAAALTAEFAPLVGAGNIHSFMAPEGSAAGADPHHPLRLLAEEIRARKILSLAPDIVHLGSVFEGWDTPLVTAWPGRLERPRSLATLYDFIPLSRRAEYLEGPWRDAGLVPWYMRHVVEMGGMDALLCISEATRQEGLRHLQMDPARLITVGTGVSARFHERGHGPSPVEGRYLLCLGLNDIRKNEARLIAAMGLLDPALRQGLRLVVTGSIPVGHLERLAREAGLAEGSILHLGFIEEAALPALYAGAALFVMPSLAEGFGLPLAEAMASGAPFCASRAGAMIELAGRDDVLFDPLDSADIARVMARILGDAGLADALRAYGPPQAARFSWMGAAERAWAAFEAHAGAPHAPRPSLAMTGPVPPQVSGIADYAAELLPVLATHYHITLVSEERPAEGVASGFAWLPPRDFARAPHRFDRVLHQLGNSALHHYQHDGLLPLRPAVSVLHDVGLSEYRRWAAREEPEVLLAALYASHGYPALLASLDGDAAMVANSLPISAQIVASSLATIVHSHAARGMLARRHGPALLRQTHVVPHLRRMPVLPARAAARARLGLSPEALVVASFGACVPKKQPLRIIEAMAAAALAEGALLAFIGAVQPGLEDVLAATAAAQGMTGRMRVTGPVARATYEDWLAATDIAVQLRGRHQGETSGAVADALAAGIACIVNARGSMAELPRDGVLLLPEEFSDAALTEILHSLAASPERRAALGIAGRRHVAESLAPARIARAYRDVIEPAHRDAPALGVLAAAAHHGAALPTAAAAALGAALAASFQLPRQSCLFIAEGAGWSRGDFTAERGLLRPEPAVWRDDSWWTDHAGLARALGLPRPAAADGMITLRPGDMVAGAGGILPDGVERA